MNTFSELGLEKDLLEVIDRAGFTEPTEIQQKTIPVVLEGKDVLAGSETGSGKTLAFGLGIIQNIQKGGGIQGLILAPTRELVEQIMKVLKDTSKYKKLSVVPIYGGVSINPQFKALEKADIVVGTPGRMLDHLERGTIDLSFVKHIVLDEADRMLDMGFIDDVRKIMSQCPKEKQTLLFSATIPPEIDRLSKKFMINPVRIKAGTYVDPTKLHQEYYDVQTSMKLSLLLHFLKEEQEGLVMVFCNSRKYTDIVAKNLKMHRLDAIAIHGGLTQAMRKDVLDKFNSGKAFILVCTDVAARGLDIPGVSHVYNYDIPDDSKQYIHRIGRTARAGEKGRVVNLISDRDYDNFSKVLRDYDIDVKKMKRPFIEKVQVSMSQPRRSGPRGRPSSHSDRRGQGQHSGNRGGPRRHSGGSRSGDRGNPRRDSGSQRSGSRGRNNSPRGRNPDKNAPRERYGNRQSRRDSERSSGPRSDGPKSRGPRSTSPRSAGPRGRSSSRRRN